MKRIFTLMLMLSLFLSMQAQLNQITPKAWYSQVKATKMPGNLEPMTVAQDFNPVVANDRGASVVIGETWYDLQSNSTMAQRFWVHDDGTMGATWTRGMTPTAYADRGTGYNYFDGTSWGAYPTERVETTRTGWPSYAPYGANGEIICSHTFTDAGLVFSWRENKGEGDWNYFTFTGPAGHEGIAWPRMITSGENNEIIHVIASVRSTVNGGSPYEGLDGALSYSRSTDGGQTWDPDNVILDGISSDYYASIDADSYAWAAPQGNTIAFVYFGGITDGVVMKSDDNGDNWERLLFYQSPKPFFTGEEGDLPMCGGGDGYNAVAIDPDGLVHVAFGRQIHVDDDPAAGWSYYPYSDGLVYWKEGMEALDTTKLTAEILPADWASSYLYQNGNLAAWTQDNGSDTIVGVVYYGASLTSMPQLVTYRNDAGVVMTHVYYAALSVGFDNSEFNYRHIWGRYTENDGRWSSFTDYTGDVFHIFSECVYPTVSQNVVNNKIWLTYQEDNMPGTSIQPDPPAHDPTLNNMVILEAGPFVPVGTIDVAGAQFSIGQSYPNPVADKAYVDITLTKAGQVTLELTSVNGQRVVLQNEGVLQAGQHVITIDASALTSGVYFYTITQGDQRQTQKLVVR